MAVPGPGLLCAVLSPHPCGSLWVPLGTGPSVWVWAGQACARSPSSLPAVGFGFLCFLMGLSKLREAGQGSVVPMLWGWWVSVLVVSLVTGVPWPQCLLSCTPIARDWGSPPGLGTLLVPSPSMSSGLVIRQARPGVPWPPSHPEVVWNVLLFIVLLLCAHVCLVGGLLCSKVGKLHGYQLVSFCGSRNQGPHCSVSGAGTVVSQQPAQRDSGTARVGPPE